MKLINKLKYVVLLLIMMVIPMVSFAETAPTKNKINVYLFHRIGCGFCESAMEFFDSIKEEYGNYFELVKYEVGSDADNAKLMDDVAAYFGEEVDGVPYIIIGNKTFPGYIDSWNDEIKQAIMKEYNSETRTDAVSSAQKGEKAPVSQEKKNSDTVILLIFGGIVVVLVGLIVFGRKKSNN